MGGGGCKANINSKHEHENLRGSPGFQAGPAPVEKFQISKVSRTAFLTCWDRF